MNRYERSSGSIGIGVSYGTNGFMVNVSASGAKGKADGADTSYTNTQIKAGNKAGDSVTLKSGGDTTLQGAVIAANAVKADIGGNLIGSDKGNAASTTSSGISGIAGNTAVRSTDAPTGLGKIFDADKVQKEVNAQTQVTQAFSKEAPKAVASYAAGQAADLRKQNNEEEAKKWDEGGVYRIALHTAAGALGGGASGAAGAATSASAAPLMNQLQDGIQERLQAAGLSPNAAKGIAQGVTALTAAGVGEAVGGAQGAATALTVDANNRQLHPTEQKKAQELAAKSGGKHTAKQVEDALRSAGNNDTGESVIAGMVVDTKDRNAIYDKGAVWTFGENGKLVQVLPPQPDAELAAFIKQNTGGTYSWYSPTASSTIYPVVGIHSLTV